jgi:hypothetical protein
MPAIRFHGFHHGHGAYQGSVLDGRPWQAGHVEEIPGDAAVLLMRDFAELGPEFGAAFTWDEPAKDAPAPKSAIAGKSAKG